MTRIPTSRRRPSGRVVRAARFGWIYFLMFLRANLEVARLVVSPRDRLAPVVMDVELHCRTSAEIALFMGLITLTPGTMAIELDDRHRWLTVHAMHAPDPAEVRGQLATLQDQMLGAVRPGEE